MDISDVSKKRCSFCEEVIPVGARRCPYCGSLLRDEGTKKEQEEVDIQIGNKSDSVEKSSYTENSSGKKENNEVTKINNGYVKASPEKLDNGNIQVPQAPLSNGMKVFLTIICTIIPGLGQLAGIILGIVFMNADNDADRKSFGVALLVASLIFFIVSCLSCFIILIGVQAVQA